MSRLLLVLLAVTCAIAAPSAQTDLDDLMSRVLARRDDNWKKLQQYVVDEREDFRLLWQDGRTLYGSRRDYLWFPRDGRFIKSPVAADGVTIGEADRRRLEALWMAREERREQRRRENPDDTRSGSSITAGPGGLDVQVQAAMRDALEPGFVSAAYFLNFKFDPGQYALVGRERYEDRDVLRVE